MGSVLIGTVASRYSDKRKSANILNNNLEVGEIAFESEESSSPAPWKNFKPDTVKQSVNIGKLAKLTDRRVQDVHQVIVEVSHKTTIFICI